MTITTQIAHHLKTLYTGGNWTTSSLKDALAGLTWQQANTKLLSFNSITALVYHCHYYVHAILQVLQGGPLLAADKFSFDHPVIASQADWDAFLNTVFSEAETLSELIAKLPDSILVEIFTDEKYGNYYRNLQGMIEHTHYHLGQIVIFKKMILANEV
jgi:uncharacterized damage-inducible protein DinB